MILNELTAVPTSAIPVTAFSEHLHLGSGFTDAGGQDTVLETYLRAALAALEARSGLALFQRRFSWGLYAWNNPNFQRMPNAPVQLIETLRLLSSNGEETLIDSEDFRLQKVGHQSRLLATGACLPFNGSVEIIFEAGFGPDWTDIPADLRQATLMLAAYHYENRNGADGGQFPAGVLALLEPYRAYRLSGGAA